MNIKQALPWQAKVVLKILLSRLPFGYRFWQRLNLFKHGAMEQPEYAHDVFVTHFNRTDFSNKSGGFTALEIGPGDTLFSAMIARAYGAKQCYLVDVGRFAREDIVPYRKMAAELKRHGLSVQGIEESTSLDALLRVCQTLYLTEGLRSFRAIPDGSIDFIWSQATLEHIRLSDFPDMMKEMRRVLRPGGICSHRVDLKDHLGGALNNLRFPTRLWESSFMARSGFYTNRIRYSEMIQHFGNAGLSVEVIGVERFASLPTMRKHLAAEFRRFPDNELLIASFDVVLRPHERPSANAPYGD